MIKSQLIADFEKAKQEIIRLLEPQRTAEIVTRKLFLTKDGIMNEAEHRLKNNIYKDYYW